MTTQARAKLVVISPEHDRADELDVLRALFAAGLVRYHVRKPHWSVERLEAWIETVPAQFRAGLVLHQHRQLVARHHLGGCHWKDAECVGDTAHRRGNDDRLTSRSCHDVAGLRAALGLFDSVFFGPLFASVSKPGHGPGDALHGEALRAFLSARTDSERRTTVLALGGITAGTAPRALQLGFDGVAVLGTVWQAKDPVRAFVGIQEACQATVSSRADVAALAPAIPNGGGR